MNDAPDRLARKYDPTVALGPMPLVDERRGLGSRAAILAAALTVFALVLVVAAGARAATGGAASVEAPAPSPAPAPVTTETPPAFDEAELSFAPYRYAGASWYGGNSMWGRTTACGQTLDPTTVGVANKRLPCGTPVKFVWQGHTIVAPVIDRGPYIRGRAWDLTEAAADAIGFEGVGRIQYAVAIE